VDPPVLTAADVDAAGARLAGIVEPSPLQPCGRLSGASGLRVYLKREDLQAVRSYKLRGAFNLMAQLTSAERTADVVCASAGNHAQGVAFAGRRLGISTRIYLTRGHAAAEARPDRRPRRRPGQADPHRRHLR